MKWSKKLSDAMWAAHGGNFAIAGQAELMALWPSFLALAAQGDADGVKRMLGNDPELASAAIDSDDRTALMLAIAGGHVECAAALAPLSDPLAVDASGRSPLMLACSMGMDSVAMDLLSRSDPLASDALGSTALMLAAAGGRRECARMLLPAVGASGLQACDSKGVTALMLASVALSPECAMILLEAGADPSARDKNGWSALGWAAWGGHASLVRKLLDAEPKPRRCLGGATVLMCAISGSDLAPRMASATQDRSEVAGLLCRAVDADAVGDDSQTALHLAAALGAYEWVKALLPWSNPNLGDNHWVSPLMMAALGGHIGCVKALLDSGRVDPCHLNIVGQTALTAVMNATWGARTWLSSEAAENGKGLIRCARILMAHPGHAGARDSSGLTPLMLACMHLPRGEAMELDLPLALIEELSRLGLLNRFAADVDRQGNTPLILSCSTQYQGASMSESAFAALLSASNPRAVNLFGRTALMSAASNGLAAKVGALATLSDVDARNKAGMTALMELSFSPIGNRPKDFTACMAALVSLSDVEAFDEHGRSLDELFSSTALADDYARLAFVRREAVALATAAWPQPMFARAWPGRI